MQDVLKSATEEVLQSMRDRERDYMERKSPGHTEQTPEQAEFTKKYWEKVFEHQDKHPKGLVVSRSVRQEMEYDDARKKFWGILQMRAAHIEVLENREFNWVIDDELKLNIQNLVKYFINDDTCRWPLTKGLFIYGAPGTTKTEIMSALSNLCFQNDLTKYFQVCSLSEIYATAKANNAHDPIQKNVEGDKCFDEFGLYTGSVNNYGNLIDINETIIEARYNRGRRYGQLTHFIANATPNELEGKFTPMVFDRLRAMCTSVHFPGESKR
jgi:DNA replication protein DnaC